MLIELDRARSALVVDVGPSRDQIDGLLPLAGEDHFARGGRDVAQRLGDAVLAAAGLLQGQRHQEGGVIGLLLEGRPGGHPASLGDGVERIGARAGRLGRAHGGHAVERACREAFEQDVIDHAVGAIVGREVAALDRLLQHGLTRAIGVGEDQQVRAAGGGQLAELGTILGLAFFVSDRRGDLATGCGVGRREVVGETLAVVVVDVGDAQLVHAAGDERLGEDFRVVGVRRRGPVDEVLVVERGVGRGSRRRRDLENAVRDRDVVGNRHRNARAHTTNDADGPIVDRLGRGGGRHIGRDAVVVAGDDLEVAAVDAALIVDVLGSQLGRSEHGRGERVERAGEAENDGDRGVSRHRGGARCEHQRGGEPGDLGEFVHDGPSENCPSPAPFMGIFEAGNDVSGGPEGSSAGGDIAQKARVSHRVLIGWSKLASGTRIP